MTIVPTENFIRGVSKYQLEILKDFDRELFRFYMVNWHRRARKTTLALNILIKECIKNPKERYGYIAPTYVSAKNIVWTDPKMIKSYLPLEAVDKINESDLIVKFKNGSVLSIHGADKPDSIRGVDFRGVVLDEYPLIKQSLWAEIIQPIMRQDNRRWALFIFTPKGKNHCHSQWISTKNNPDWKHYTLTAEKSGIIPSKELEKAKNEMPERLYLQEFCCEFNDDASSVFRGINDCIANGFEKPIAGRSYVTGVDLAKSVDYTVIITMCRETKHVVSFNRFNKIDWNLQKERIINECRTYNSQLCIDASGVGDPIVEDLKRAGVCIPANGMVKFNNENKKAIIERLVVSIEQRLITFPKIQDLIDELSAFTCELTPSRNIVYTAPEGVHDDCVIALGLCVHGLRNFLYSDNSQRRIPKQTLITGGVY